MYTTRPSRVKRLMREGKIALGTYAHMVDPSVVEISALAGFDAVSVHWEHTSIDYNILERIIRAADASDIDCIVRVPENDRLIIKRVLDLGAHGIWLPHDSSGLEGVKRALDIMKYPPKGTRPPNLRTRATGYGGMKWEDHYKHAQEEVILVVPIEDKKAMDEVDQIAALDGVDLLFVAVFDVAEAIGLEWDSPNHPLVFKKWQEIAERVRKAGKARMMIPYDHTHMKLKPQDLESLYCGYAHVVPQPTTILATHFQQKSAEIRKVLGEV